MRSIGAIQQYAIVIQRNIDLASGRDLASFKFDTKTTLIGAFEKPRAEAGMHTHCQADGLPREAGVMGTSHAVVIAAWLMGDPPRRREGHPKRSSPG
jgi:hypothetical protein